MQYDVLLPANYDPAIKYPTMLYLHQLDMGTDPSDLLAEVKPWFNTAAFRASTPSHHRHAAAGPDCRSVRSDDQFRWRQHRGQRRRDQCDRRAEAGESQYSSDPSRVYVTGNSMGGIGTEDMLIKYNAYTGTEGKIFAAGLALAGADYGQGYPQPNASVVAGLKNVPFWAIHGGQDTQVPLAWDQNLYAAEQAAGGDHEIHPGQQPGSRRVGHLLPPDPAPSSPLGWLFSQSTGGQHTAPTPPPTRCTPSPNNTVVTGTASAITDASGNKWTITSGGQVAINGTADTTTSGVIELAYVNGTIWQENSSKLWWGETQPNASWAPSAGTATSPLPATPTPPPAIIPSANNTVVTGTTAAITDASGNKWTITSGGQVAINGIADTTTRRDRTGLRQRHDLAGEHQQPLVGRDASRTPPGRLPPAPRPARCR